jgi:hypothetical protein
MTPRRDALRAGAHWHVDCRLEGELPKDDAVSGQLLAKVVSGIVTLGLLLVFSWMAYHTFKVSREVQDLENRIAVSKPEVNAIRELQRQYNDEASKVDRAYATIRPALFVSEFIGAVARTLPPKVNIEGLVWNDNEIMMRGVVPGSRQVASPILASFLDALNKDPSISAQIIEIRPLGMDYTKGNFTIRFRLRPLPPL